ncbi:hypothetical protein ACQUJS_14845 [Ralstonia pseudosolanacearum]|uniref:Lipoprotein n=1 Tax=Ralstonia solanacearum TaxID=305 RepID=A0A0S4TWP8_RALSL|nr:hypothetical protein [Ralstonia pseudosolanacearum]OAI79425.1 lipoprotein [Ralstonia solanacearum]QCX47671.1 hypothetical protein E7Z57_00205 [Ralstonia pseudosolanacearum]CUV14277.1 Lipoprotein [Ralstonia solanacearum]
MKITSTLARAGLCGALAVLLAGCMTTTPVYDKHFGEAVRTVTSMQTLNPRAAANTDPVFGMDGRSATAAMDRYDTSFQTPQRDANAYRVGVGSSNTLSSMGR